MPVFHFSDGFLQTFTPENAIHASLSILLAVRTFFAYYYRILVTRVAVVRFRTLVRTRTGPNRTEVRSGVWGWG